MAIGHLPGSVDFGVLLGTRDARRSPLTTSCPVAGQSPRDTADEPRRFFASGDLSAVQSNKRMQLTKLRAAPERRAEVPPCAPAGETDGGTASQLIRSVRRTMVGRVAEVAMTRRAIVTSGAALVILVAGATAHAQGLPTCRVRMVKSAATEAVAKSVFRQVETWVDARERGCRLVSSIGEADVLLEFNDYRPTTTRDGTPSEEWRFIARRLSEPVRERATYRFAYVTWLDRRTKAYVAKQLPTVLADVCFGYLPKVASSSPDRQ